MTTSWLGRTGLSVAFLLCLTGCARIEKVLAFGATADGVDRSVRLDPPRKATKASCAGKLINDDRLAAPAGLPRFDDTSWMQGRPEVGAQVFLGWVRALDGRATEIRDSLLNEGRARGFEVAAQPVRDDVFEVAYTGRADVSISVQPYCRGHLALRYVVRSVDVTPPALPAPAAAARRACPTAPPEAVLVAWEQTLVGLAPGAQPLRTGALADADAYTSVSPGLSAAATRDGLLATLRTAGYVADRLPVAGGVAAATIAGRRVGMVSVQPWCKGRLVTRFLLAPYAERELPSSSATRPCTGRDQPEPVTDALPPALARPEQRLLFERRSGTLRFWQALTESGGRSLARAGSDLARVYTARGLTVTPLTAPEGLRAAVLTADGSRALLVVRPHCFGRFAEQLVVAG